MKWRKWLENWDMTSLKIKAPFLEMEWEPREADKQAAWEMYIELLTRIVSQPLAPGHGDEAAALKSVHSLFSTTREILRRNGRDCIEFTKLAVIVLNQIVRPFTAEWHGRSLAGAFSQPEGRQEFRESLERLRLQIQRYMGMLAQMAGVEDLTGLESELESAGG